MSNNKKHELVIIGAGPGGYRAAFMAADLGVNVTMIDPEKNPGGLCLYRGCIPSKALLHAAKIIKDANHAERIGIRYSSPEIDIKKVREWKNQVVTKLTGGLGQLVKAKKFKYIRSKASFADSETLTLENGEKISFEKAIIAAGAKPLSLPGIEINNKDIIDSSTALDMNDIPKKMLIVGGGYIGLEMATIYQTFGTNVSIAELTEDFMPGMDKDLIREYKKENKNTFKDVYFETKVENIDKKQDAIQVNFKDKDNKSFSGEFDKILIAIGHTPGTKNLGLENTSVEINEKGFIKTDNQQRTADKNIFAIGDIAGPPMLAHKASYEGKVAAEVIAGKKSINDAKAIPAVVYTEPEIATCGLSEIRAKEENIQYKTVKFPWSASGRAATMNEKTGLTKLLIHPENERILGAGIVGKNAGDMIPELTLAIEMASTAKDISLTIHPHPTTSETIMEAAEIFYRHPGHIHVKR
jgi:dihydrolipoamide dehydrogenase